MNSVSVAKDLSFAGVLPWSAEDQARRRRKEAGMVPREGSGVEGGLTRGSWAGREVGVEGYVGVGCGGKAARRGSGGLRTCVCASGGREDGGEVDGRRA